MPSQKIQVKIFAECAPDTVDYVAVFQRWIRDHSLEELLIDVVDYSHVADGPEVALIGHESDYVMDRAEARLGLLCFAKRVPASAENPYLGAIRRAVRACRLLENENSIAAPLRFRSNELQIRIADRLSAPNTDATFEREAPALRAALARLYGSAPFTLERYGSARELFGVRVSAPAAPPLAELASRLTIAA